MEGVVEDNTDLLAILEEYKILLSTQSEVFWEVGGEGIIICFIDMITGKIS